MRSLGIPKLAWRKGSAWNALIRVHATIVAEDVRVFDALKKGCRDDEGKFILIIVRAISLTCFCNSRVLWISFWAEVHYNSIYTADAAV